MNPLTSNTFAVRFFTAAVIVLSKDIFVISESLKEEKQEAYSKPIFRLDSGQPVNVTYLVSEYILTCGSNDDFCHTEKLPFNISLPDNSGCLRTTNCNKECAMSQSCSPDAENAYISVSCISTDLFPTSMRGINMVTKCPQYTTAAPTFLKLCDNIGDLNDTNMLDETFKPVISKQSNTVYRNKFCAACSNELDTMPFKLELKCDQYFDINSFSSKSEMMQAIKANYCSLTYVPPVEHVVTCPVYINYISICNASGLWFNYDPQIDWACHNFNSFPYKGYKNIFCYICNPIIVSTSAVQVIDSCNMTRQLEKKDTSLERGCLELPTANRPYPFKNRFCQLCNGFASGFRHLKNFSLYVAERGLYHANIKVTFHGFSLAEGSPSQAQLNFDKLNSSLDIDFDNALRELERFCGDVRICNDANDPFLITDETYTNCFFSCECGKNSCLDLLPTDTCKPGRIYDTFSELCENSTIGDILDTTLVRSKTTYRVYKNIYCARCNDDIGDLESESFDITCGKPLEASLSDEITDVSQIIFENECETEFLPPPNFYVFDPHSQIQTFFSECKSSCIRKCKHRKYWRKNNKKVLDLCETEHLYFSRFPSIIYNSTTYKNVFCLICNRDVALHSEEELVSTCSGTVNYDMMTETQCHNVSTYPGWYPFKNIFCAACNGYRISMDTYSTNCEFGCSETKSPYRTVFSLRAVQLPEEDDTRNKLDNNSATFCPKGRSLTGRVCKLLIEETSDLGYNITFGLRLKNISYHARVKLDLNCLRQEILNHWDILNQSVAVVQIDIGTDGDCHERANFENYPSHSQCYDNQDTVTRGNSSLGSELNRHTTRIVHELAISGETKLNLNVLLYVQNTKNRTELEEKLLELNSLVLNASSSVGFVQLEPFPVDTRTECHTDSQNNKTCHYSIQDHDSYRNIIDDMNINFVNVNGLLACALTEIELEKDIVEILCTSNMTFRVSDDKKKIILCLEDRETLILSAHPVKRDLFQYAHEVFSLICTLLSLTCLFLAFVTYLLFSSLRNIPGINNMNLVFALFWAQLLLQFGLWQTGYPNVCIFLGIANHYFWLASFFSMSVCSYHMFKVFHTKMLVSNSINKRIVIYYSIYIYGAPLIIISVFLIVISTTSNFKDTGYGKGICFLSNHTFVLVMFVTPAILIILTDTFFFAVAYWHIRSSPRIGNKSNRNDFIIYLKLMTVTGVAWILLFIDTLNPLSIFSFIATLASALQGVYIFIAFICNAKVCSLYRNKLCGKITLNRSDITSSELIQCQFVKTQETHI